MASNFQLRRCREILLCGGIISYKTDTLYGLSCDPYNVSAVKKLTTIKHRPVDKAFILLAGNFEQLFPFIDPSVIQHKQTITHTQTPTSWILPVGEQTPSWLMSATQSIAIRISHDPITTRLCKMLNSPIISTSANIHGRQPANSLIRLKQIFGASLDLIIQSPHQATGTSSTLRRLCDNTVIRP